jgi:hypothetical protein
MHSQINPADSIALNLLSMVVRNVVTLDSLSASVDCLSKC